MELTLKQKQYIKHVMLRNTDLVPEEMLAQQYGVEVEDILSAAVNMNIERCGGCDWWFEVCLLDEDGYCTDCAECCEY